MGRDKYAHVQCCAIITLYTCGRMATVATDYQLELVEKRNTKSPVWRHFAFEAGINGKPKNIDKLRCKLCKEVTAHFGNTSNLFTHVRIKHPDVYTVLAKERQEIAASSSTKTQENVSRTSIITFLEERRKLDKSSREHKKLTKSITMYLAVAVSAVQLVQLWPKHLLTELILN